MWTFCFVVWRKCFSFANNYVYKFVKSMGVLDVIGLLSTLYDLVKYRTEDIDYKIDKAVKKALKTDDESYLNNARRQVSDLIDLLVQIVNSPESISTIDLPNFIDRKELRRFYDEMCKDIDTWGFLQMKWNEYINKDIHKVVKGTDEKVDELKDDVKEIKTTVHEIANGKAQSNEHFLTSTPPKADATNVIGREKDLQALWEVLNDKKHVILTGFGGIGKTKLAQMLFHQYEAKFDEVAWVEYRGNLMDSFLASITVKQFSESNYGNDKVARWNAINSSLTNDGKTKLIIIDNVNGDTNQHPRQDVELKNLTGWKDTVVLLTSRLDRLGGFQKIELKELTEDCCIDLFYYYFGNTKPTREIVAKIVGLANMHTFTIELLAKGAEREDLEKYYERLIEKGFGDVTRVVDAGLHLKETTIEKHLKILFDMQNRSNEDKKVLNSFAVLPEYCRCSMEEIQNWFGFGNADLDQVIRDGWLTYNENDQRYYIHSLVRTIIRFDFLEDGQGKKTIAPDGTIDKILEFLSIDPYWCRIDDGYTSLQRRIDIVESIISSVVQEETETLASVFHNLGYGYNAMGNYDKALEYFEKALEIRESKLGKDHPSTASTYNNIGEVYRAKGDYDKALEYYGKAMEIKESKLGKDHPVTAATYNNIGGVYGAKGDYDEALEYCEKAMIVRQFRWGENHPNTATVYNNIAVEYYAKDDFDNALVYFKKALEIRESKSGRNHLETATTYNNIAVMYRKIDDYVKALEYFGKALEIRESKLGKDHPYTATTYNNIAGMYYAKGDYDKVLEYYEKALEIRESKLGKDHPSTATTYNNIALVYYAKDDYNNALEYFLKAVKILLFKNKNHPNTESCIRNLAICYQEANMEKEMDEWMKERLNEKEWEAYLELKGLL